MEVYIMRICGLLNKCIVDDGYLKNGYIVTQNIDYYDALNTEDNMHYKKDYIVPISMYKNYGMHPMSNKYETGIRDTSLCLILLKYSRKNKGRIVAMNKG